MDWIGIGVLLIGVAFLILVIFLIKPLNKLTNVLKKLQKVTDNIPNTVNEITGQTTSVLQSANKTIENVNKQVTNFQPLFQLVGDIGEASQELTAIALNKTLTLKQNTTEASDFTLRKQYEGVFGLLSLLFYFTQKKRM